MILSIPLGLTPFDVAGPGLLAAAGFSVAMICLVSLLIVAIESLVLWRLKWGTLPRSILASLVMNLVTTIIGVALIILFPPQSDLLTLLIDFVLSVLVEGGILMLFKRSSARENWIAALAANTASYLLFILLLYVFPGLQL